MSRYAEFHRRSINDRDAFWAEQAQADRLADAAAADLRLQPSAVCALVRRRHHQSVPQRGRPASERAGRAGGADLRQHRDRAGEGLHLPRAARRGAAHGGRCCAAGRAKGRPRADLHAHDCRGGLCHAGLRAHRRHPLGGVRRLCLGLAGLAHRGCRAQGGDQRRRRFARRQGGGLQAAAGRGDPPVEAQARFGAAGGSPARAHGTGGRARPALGPAARTSI